VGSLLHTGAGPQLLNPHNLNPEAPTGRSKGRADNPDATHFERLHPDAQKSIENKIKEGSPKELGHLHMDRLVENIKSVYRDAKATNPSAIKEGKTWYRDGHNFAKNQMGSKTAEGRSVSLRHRIGMVAALSPQAHWEENKTLAGYMHHHLSAHPDSDDGRFQISHEGLAKAHADIASGVRKGEGGNMTLTPGKKFSDMSPEEAAQSLKAQAKYHHELKVPGRVKKDGDPWRATFSMGTGNMAKAVRIHRGEDPDSALNGHKVRSFFNNLADPDNKQGRDSVTIDTHAVSLASHAKFGASSPELGKLFSDGHQKEHNLQGTYSYFASAYRKAHQDLKDSGEMDKDSHVHHLQASTWLHWRDMTDNDGPIKEANKGRFPEYSTPKKQQETNKQRAITRTKLLNPRAAARKSNSEDVGPLLDPTNSPDPDEKDPDFDTWAASQAEEAEWEAEPDEMARREAEKEVERYNRPFTSAHNPSRGLIRAIAITHDRQSPAIDDTVREGYGLDDEDTGQDNSKVASAQAVTEDEMLFDAPLPVHTAAGQCWVCKHQMLPGEEVHDGAHAFCQQKLTQGDTRMTGEPGHYRNRRELLDNSGIANVAPVGEAYQPEGRAPYGDFQDALRNTRPAPNQRPKMERLPIQHFNSATQNVRSTDTMGGAEGNEVGDTSQYREDAEGDPNPSEWWLQQHSPNGPNPASTGPIGFGERLDPESAQYSQTMGQPEADEKLLDPGPALSGMTMAPGWGFDSTASLHSADVHATCRHCQRSITRQPDGSWVNPDATGDDSIWRETCEDNHGSFAAEHEPHIGGDRERTHKPYQLDTEVPLHHLNALETPIQVPSVFVSPQDPRQVAVAMQQSQQVTQQAQASTGREWLLNGSGGGSGPSESDIAKSAKAHLAALSAAEQQELIKEGEAEGVRARNFDLLRLEGTHYMELEARLQAEETEDPEMLW
jgi:hypothetical protein